MPARAPQPPTRRRQEARATPNPRLGGAVARSGSISLSAEPAGLDALVRGRGAFELLPFDNHQMVRVIEPVAAPISGLGQLIDRRTGIDCRASLNSLTWRLVICSLKLHVAVQFREPLDGVLKPKNRGCVRPLCLLPAYQR